MDKMFRLRGLLIWAMALGMSSQVLAEKSPKHGEILWAKNTIRATGSGAPDLKAANVAVARLGAERAAKLDALRNILEATKGVRVSTNKSVGHVLAGNQALEAKIQGWVKGFRVIDTRYYSDGGVDLVVEVDMDGVLFDAFLKGAKGKKADAHQGKEPDLFTGLILNAKGLGFEPALAPSVVSESGEKLFDVSFVHQDVLAKSGVVAYADTLDKAQKDKRSGARPLVIRALRTISPASSDLVVPDKDVDKLKSLGGILAAGKVLVVID